MSTKFKKGHIIPRWCHVKTDDRKAQHNCKFGCDVEVTVLGGVVKVVALSPGPVICVTGKKGPSRRMKGGSIKYSRAVVGPIQVTPHGLWFGVKDHADNNAFHWGTA